MYHVAFYNTESNVFNKARLDHLNSLQLPFLNKKVTEYGAGIGLLTPNFISQNCNVTVIEARDSNIEALKKNLEGVTIEQFNLEEENWDSLPKSDIGFAYGLLYHLSNPKRFIENIAMKSTEFVVLETVVYLDGSDDAFNFVKEDSKAIIQSFSGGACRPTRQFVWKTFKENFPYVYVPRTQPNHPDFPLQFKEQHHNTIRFIIIGSKMPLINDLLSDSLLNNYTQ